jgi:anti-sigma factor RsiW
MTDPDVPVTEDELHAYVDGELPADRRPAIEAWLATHPDDMARVTAWRALADAIRARYGAVATEPVPARLSLRQIERAGRSWRGVAAAAAVAAFLLGGAAGWAGHDFIERSPNAAARSTAEAVDAYRTYVVEVRHPVEVPGNEEAHLTQWLSKRVGYQLRIPDLSPAAPPRSSCTRARPASASRSTARAPAALTRRCATTTTARSARSTGRMATSPMW